MSRVRVTSDHHGESHSATPFSSDTTASRSLICPSSQTSGSNRATSGASPPISTSTRRLPRSPPAPLRWTKAPTGKSLSRPTTSWMQRRPGRAKTSTSQPRPRTPASHSPRSLEHIPSSSASLASTGVAWRGSPCGTSSSVRSSKERYGERRPHISMTSLFSPTPGVWPATICVPLSP